MSEIQRLRQQLSPRSRGQQDRVLQAEVVRFDRTIVAMEGEAELQVQRNRAIGYVGTQAMHDIAFLSEMEGRLATLCPLATTRLQVIADTTAMSMAQTVAETYRKVQ